MSHAALSWNFETGDRGWLATGRYLVLRALIWAAVLFAIVLGFFLLAVLGLNWLHLPEGPTYVAAVVIPIFAVLAYRALVIVVEKRRATELAGRPFPGRDIAIGFVAGIAVVGAMLLLLLAFGLYETSRGSPDGLAALRSLVFNSYISAVLEELAFRAVLLRLFARAFGPIAGLVLSSALFGAAHLSHGSWIAAAEIAFNGGLIMGLLYMTTGRLWMCMGLHLGWDFSEETLFGINTHSGLLQSVPVATKNVLFTGGTYGPDGSLYSVIVGIVAIVIILAAYRRTRPFTVPLSAR